jgi:hypothetical protein
MPRNLIAAVVIQPVHGRGVSQPLGAVFQLLENVNDGAAMPVGVICHIAQC